MVIDDLFIVHGHEWNQPFATQTAADLIDAASGEVT